MMTKQKRINFGKTCNLGSQAQAPKSPAANCAPVSPLHFTWPPAERGEPLDEHDGTDR